MASTEGDGVRECVALVVLCGYLWGLETIETQTAP